LELKMQMYRVRFAQPMANKKVDHGDCIVCANSSEDARLLVISHLGVRSAEFDISRIKPSLFQISREIIDHSLAGNLATIFDEASESRATFPGITESLPDEFWHTVFAEAIIRAENEEKAIMKLSVAIRRQLTGEQQKRSTKDLNITCDRVDSHPRSPAIERSAIFKEIRIFAGGATRGK